MAQIALLANRSLLPRLDCNHGAECLLLPGVKRVFNQTELIARLRLHQLPRPAGEGREQSMLWYVGLIKMQRLAFAAGSGAPG
jgi:hypothetical protein